MISTNAYNNKRYLEYHKKICSSLMVDRSGPCSVCCIRGSYALGKMFDKTSLLLDVKLSKAFEFVCNTSLYGMEQTLEECSPSKSIVLVLLYGLIHKDHLLCQAMADLANQLPPMSPLSLATSLIEEFVFNPDQVEKGIHFLNNLIENGFITVPKQVCDIFASLLQKCFTQEYVGKQYSHKYNRDANYFGRTEHMKCAFHMQRNAQHFQSSMTDSHRTHTYSMPHCRRLNLKRRCSADDNFFTHKDMKANENGNFVWSPDEMHYFSTEHNNNRNMLSRISVRVPIPKSDFAVQTKPLSEDKGCNTELRRSSSNLDPQQGETQPDLRDTQTDGRFTVTHGHEISRTRSAGGEGSSQNKMKRLAEENILRVGSKKGSPSQSQTKPLTEERQCKTEPADPTCSPEQDILPFGLVPYSPERLPRSHNNSRKGSTEEPQAQSQERRGSSWNEAPPMPPMEGPPSLRDVVRSVSSMDESLLAGTMNSPASTEIHSPSKKLRRMEPRTSPAKVSTPAIVIIKTEIVDDSEDCVSIDMNPLERAVLNGDESTVQKLLQQRTDVNSPMSTAASLIFLALANRNMDMMKLLINLGVSVNGKNVDGATPLQYAVEAGFNDEAKLLISSNADIYCKTESGDSLLHIAVVNNNMEMLKLLITLHVDPNIRNNKHLTPLHYAVKTENTQAVSVLISMGADVRCRVHGRSFLRYAANHAPKMVGKLLKSDILNFTDEDQESLQDILFIASKNGSCEFFPELLKANVDVRWRDESGWTALHHAVIHGHKEIVSLLLNKGADANALGARGCTPLHLAANNNQTEIVPLLLDHGADINARDRHDSTPYDHAVKWSYDAMAELLKKAAEKT